MIVEHPRLLGKAMAIVLGAVVALIALAILLIVLTAAIGGKNLFGIGIVLVMLGIGTGVVYDELVKKHRYKNLDW